MNRQGPTGIGWCDFTWNPVTGCWGPGGTPEKPSHCPYCYAKRIYEERLSKSFEPTFHPERLGQPAKEKQPSKIFVCSTGDLFGDWVPRDWIEAVLDVVKQCPQHTFQFLTKNPARYKDFRTNWPDNAWAGMSVSQQAAFSRKRWDLGWSVASVVFVSFEPLLGPTRLAPRTGRWLSLSGEVAASHPAYRPYWAIIGEQTGPGPKPPVEDVVRWATDLMADLRRLDIPIFVKRPLSNRIPNAPKQFPG